MAAGGPFDERVAPPTDRRVAVAEPPSLAARVIAASEVDPRSGSSGINVFTMWHGTEMKIFTGLLSGLKSGIKPRQLPTINIIVKEMVIHPVAMGKVDKLIFSSEEDRNTFIEKLSATLKE